MLSGNSRISVATKKKVHDVIAELGYQPNNSARSLSLGEANQVGVIFPPLEHQRWGNDNFQLQIVNGVNEQLQKRGYVLAVAVAQTWEELLENVRKMAEQSQIRHFVVLYAASHDAVVSFLKETKQNFVVVGTPSEIYSFSSYVDNDNQRASYAATKKLLEQHKIKAPLFVESVHKWLFEQKRHEGFKQALETYRLSSQNLLISPDTPLTNSQLKKLNNCDALVCSSDNILLHLFVQLIGTSRRNIPVMCFNVNPLVKLLCPNVSIMVDMKPLEIGRETVAVLFDDNKHHEWIGFDIKQ